MNPPPTCMTCDHWHPYHPWDGYCTQSNIYTSNTDACDKHVPIKIKLNKLKKPVITRSK